MATKTCAICGKPSGMYPLCTACFKLRDNGEVTQCEECKTWHKVEDSCKCKSIHTCTCLICENKYKTNKQQDIPYCHDCEKEIKLFKNELIKKSKYEIKDYFFNISRSLWKNRGNIFAKSSYIKMISLAEKYKLMTNENDLIEKAKIDIKSEKIKANEKLKNTNEEEKILTREKEIETIERNLKDNVNQDLVRTKDGHKLESQGELTIDDILFDAGINHAYACLVHKIAERAVYCDWYLPIMPNDGIYIEYWGMEKKDYIDNKEEKQELYAKYNLCLINIEINEPKDTAALTSKIKSEYEENKKKIFTKHS